ncbi:MAG: beta-L-arabinofuranosidase domain-containing protein [Armatimonadota bacterium]
MSLSFRRNLIVLVLLGLCTSAYSQTVSSTDDQIKKGIIRMNPLFQRDPGTKYEFEGFVSDYINAASDNWLKVILEKNPRLFDDIANRNKEPYPALEPWAGEFTGKHLTGAVEVYRITRDPELRDNIVKFVDKLISLQAENGYLGVFPDAYQLTGKQPAFEPPITCDTWNHYHIMLGLILWYKESGDQKALNAAKKIGDLMCEKFLGKPGSLAAIGVREFNLAPSHSLALLYKEAKEKRYLDLAVQIVEEEYPVGYGEGIPRGSDFVNKALEGVEYYQNTAPGGPRWENMHTLMALSELYWITGNAKYAKALEQIWWSIDKTDRHNNGGWGSMEQAFGSPYEVRPKELCCGVAWMGLAVELMKLTADSVVADELELTFMNFALGFSSRSGLWQSYNVPSDGKITMAMPGMGDPNRPNNVEICCCTVNGARGFGLLTEWALMQDKDGLALNWYGPSTLTAHVNGVEVALKQETDYPRNGNITLHVDPEHAAEFTLKLRIPHWSRNTKVLVNGMPVDNIAPGRYLPIRREWKPGDVVTLKLDMSTHFWVGENEAAGRASFYRGPVLLAYPRKNPKDYMKFTGEWGMYLSARHLPYVDLPGSKRPGDTVAFDFEGESIAFLYNTLHDCGKAEVKIDGKQAAVVDMFAPIDQGNFSALFTYKHDEPNMFLSARWEKTGLTPGKHRIEITVLPEKNEQSVGNWVNVSEFVAAGDDPVFDVRTMGGKLLRPRKNGFPILEMEFTDIKGQKVRLRDFDSATEEFNPYISWIKAVNAPKVEFSRENPTRSARVK